VHFDLDMKKGHGEIICLVDRQIPERWPKNKHSFSKFINTKEKS
jgi:hypothetical protein